MVRGDLGDPDRGRPRRARAESRELEAREFEDHAVGGAHRLDRSEEGAAEVAAEESSVPARREEIREELAGRALPVRTGDPRDGGGRAPGEEEADLGDEGRLPPTLTGAGARLTTAWMHDVLAEDDADAPDAGPSPI